MPAARAASARPLTRPASLAQAVSPVDQLGEALHFLRMNGIFYSRSELGAPWGLELPPFEACMIVHLVTAGQAWMEVEGAAPRRLEAGSLALVPHGEGHRLVSAPGGRAAALFDLPREMVSDKFEIIRQDGGGAPTTMICGVVRFDHPAARQLIRLLPREISVVDWTSAEREWTESTMRFIAAEARQLRPGGEAVITRLADILIIQAIRSWIASDPAAQTGWLGALRDPQIGRAIAAIHGDATRLWTLGSLAAEVGMSRTVFAARFRQLVGEPAMHYLARWKMNAAMTWLKEENDPVGELARRLGYESEAAFSRAFKRFMGVAPGAVRAERKIGRRSSRGGKRQGKPSWPRDAS